MLVIIVRCHKIIWFVNRSAAMHKSFHTKPFGNLTCCYSEAQASVPGASNKLGD